MFEKFLLAADLLLLICVTSVIAQPRFENVKQELVFDNPPFKQCHASTMVETERGNILLACFGGTQESKPDVQIWLSYLKNNKFSQPISIANGIVNDTLRYPAWNPVLFKEHGGKLFLFYKVGPNPRKWWGMLKTSINGGKTWSDAFKLPEGILGPIKNKPVQLADGSILSPSSIEEENGRWKAHIEKSNDKGQTWSVISIDNDSMFDVIQPSILTYNNDRLQIVCRSKNGNVLQAWSADRGKTWSKLSKTALLNPNSGIDAVTLKNGLQLIVYNPDVPGKDWMNGRSKLRVACSTDGNNWTDVAALENGTTEEYSYPAIIQSKDGLIHISYTYDRKNIKHVILKQIE
jgi:predicted neuraminidase